MKSISITALIAFLATGGCSVIKVDDVATVTSKTGAACSIPANLPRPKVERGPAMEAITPDITRYTLALSWSPQFCRSRENDPRHATQCAAEKDFGFVLHGLWPEGAGKTAPTWCAPAEVLPTDVIRTNFCASPSPQLLQHEWAKHGTCMTRDPTVYFQKARTLYESVKLPDMDALSRGGANVSGLIGAIKQLNPTIPARAIMIDTTRGNWLTEIKICYDSQFQPTACAKARSPRDGARVKIWRSIE